VEEIKQMLLSFFSTVKADTFSSLPAAKLFSPQQITLMQQAKAIVLPPQCQSYHYWFCKRFAPVFPSLDTRFQFPGKVGHIFVFKWVGVPYPPTRIFTGLKDLQNRLAQGESLYPYPFIVKWNKGGGGAFVHLVHNEKELFSVLDVFKTFERKGPTFIIQPYIEHDNRDLRVVVIGTQFFTYWRCQQNPNEFRSNVGRGAKICYHLHPKLEQKAINLVKQVCRKTGINLAAFDLMFSEKEKTPLFLEINYGFGLLGIGGFQQFKAILNAEVQKWASQFF